MPPFPEVDGFPSMSSSYKSRNERAQMTGSFSIRATISQEDFTSKLYFILEII